MSVVFIEYLVMLIDYIWVVDDIPGEHAENTPTLRKELFPRHSTTDY